MMSISVHQSFVASWQARLDENGQPRDTGNPLTEWGTALMLARTIGMRLGSEEFAALSGLFNRYLNRLQFSPVPLNLGLYARKLDGDGRRVTDDVTHDDLKGLFAADAAMRDGEYARRIVGVMKDQSVGPLWFYSPERLKNWASLVKVADEAYYALRAGLKPCYLSKSALRISFSLATNRMGESASDDRLSWLMAETLAGKDLLLDFGLAEWFAAMRKNGGVHRIMFDYHAPKDLSHPFVTFTEGM